jgi:hypothetical protein
MYVVTELLKSGGQLVRRPSAPGQLSPRSKGLRQGVMMMLSTLVIVPLMGILGAAMLGLPGELVGATAVILMMGGFLRMMYALLFESSEAPEPAVSTQQQYVPPASVPNYLGMHQTPSALPPQQSAPVNMYRAPHRFDTGEIAPPSSVTDHTTRLLDKQLDKQPDESPKE